MILDLFLHKVGKDYYELIAWLTAVRSVGYATADRCHSLTSSCRRCLQESERADYVTSGEEGSVAIGNYQTLALVFTFV